MEATQMKNACSYAIDQNDSLNHSFILFTESPALSRLGGCFPGSSLVLTPQGARPVSTIRPGDMVRVRNPSGSPIFSPVLMMIHSNEKSRANFLRIHTKSGRKLNITPSHLLMIVDRQDNPEHKTLNETRSLLKSIFAGQIRMGDQLVILKDAESFELDEIVGLTSAELDGVFAPLTNEGNIIVDDALVSCYANIDSQALAHWSFLPVRVYYRIKTILMSAFEALGLFTIDSNLQTMSGINKNNKSTEHGSVMQLKISDGRATNQVILSPNVHSSKGRFESGSHFEENIENKTQSKLAETYRLELNGHLTRKEGEFSQDQVRRREVMSNPDVADSSIHWYARCLYAVARLVLPKDWIVS
ncbi:hypothetical protein HAZT_HAZT006413 [Hyalella azteca]|uniref:Hint domain-containing protein n=1 Tax=Hyalella azteca TaxID=294128 RepID=A0A6A0H7P4_HYAAZ|nr:hypothetical protein HAZT_HAZT006413 [Hyalella azteca]